MEFEWDAAKAASNRRKHGVSFQEAATVFDDPRVALFYDEEHSGSEDRYLAIGVSDKGRVIVVSHTYRADATRIISARKATATEAQAYGQS
jgi:hypothetical protein